MSAKKDSVEVNVEKEAKDIGVAIAKLLTVGNSALEDGFQAGQDIPTVLMGSYKELSEAFEGMEDAIKTFKEDPVASSAGVILPILEAVQEIRRRSKAGEVPSANKVGSKK